jgi:hypothetical protein
MPLFPTADPIDSTSVVRKWAELYPRQAPLKVAGTLEVVTEYVTDDRSLMVAFVDMPVPGDEAVHAVRSSWMWQQPDTCIREHRTHAVVMTNGDTSAGLQPAWDVTRLSAAILAARSGVALYWGNARQVHAPKIVTDFSAEEDHPPVPLWVGVTISGDGPTGPFDAATHGLESLGHKEFEVLRTRMNIGDLRMTLLNLASYVLEKGPVLVDGQTFGPTAEDRWLLRHRPSRLVEDRQVIVLGIP